jgi:hypothetical protein
MAITDINISEELQTGAPSIKYTGNEGPQAPMQMAGADPILIEEYEKYVYEMQEQGLEPMTFEQFVQEIKSGFAFGGRAGSDGRRRYGFGSIKDRIRKIMPNEVARVAEVAAPFVAPFNPIAGGLMAGFGGFDRHGSLGRGLKSGLMNYGMGQVARGIGGGAQNLQAGFNPMGGMGPAGQSAWSSPISSEGGLGKIFSDKGSLAKDGSRLMDSDPFFEAGIDKTSSLELTKPKNISFLDKALSKMGMNTAAMAGIVGASALAGLYTKKNPGDDSIEQMRGSGLDIAGIREEVTEAMKDPSGEKLAAIRGKYPFLGARETIDVDLLAKGGSAKKKKTKYKYQGMEFDYPVGPEGSDNISNPPKRYEVAEGGIMDLGGMEKDYRNEGGFVPIGEKEKADDVPARLSVNEFVMTADAVRGMGDGDIDLGAERMEDLMETLEAKGKRHQGASEMFEVSERLSEVV